MRLRLARAETVCDLEELTYKSLGELFLLHEEKQVLGIGLNQAPK